MEAAGQQATSSVAAFTSITCQPKAWMDTGGFAMYIDTVLGPRWQPQKNSSDNRMLPVCDNASMHTADDLKEILDQHGIILRFLPPNMTQWLQPLDLVVCGLIKTLRRARRGKHLATDLRNWRNERDRIVGRAVLAQQQPPPLEPWKPRNPTMSLKVSSSTIRLIMRSW